MHDARRPVREAHIERPSTRRDTLSVGISFVIHALVVLLVVFFWNGSVGGAPAESNTTADVILEEAARGDPLGGVRNVYVLANAKVAVLGEVARHKLGRAGRHGRAQRESVPGPQGPQ